MLVRGAPLADDLNNCLAPRERGLPGFLSESFERLGLIRPARFVEIFLTTGVCRSAHFGVAIAVSLAATVAVALLLRRLVSSLGAAAPWPDFAAAVWLLQPLGTEVALWPAALHVPLGLAAALAALLALRRERLWLGVLLGLVAMLCVEQVILALPLAAWLVSPPARRRAAAVAMGAVAAVVVLAYLLVPGNDPRLSAGAADRAQGLVTDLAFVVRVSGGRGRGRVDPAGRAVGLPAERPGARPRRGRRLAVGGPRLAPAPAAGRVLVRPAGCWPPPPSSCWSTCRCWRASPGRGRRGSSRRPGCCWRHSRRSGSARSAGGTGPGSWSAPPSVPTSPARRCRSRCPRGCGWRRPIVVERVSTELAAQTRDGDTRAALRRPAGRGVAGPAGCVRGAGLPVRLGRGGRAALLHRPPGDCPGPAGGQPGRLHRPRRRAGRPVRRAGRGAR